MEQGIYQSPVWGLKNQLAQIEQNDPRSSSQAVISNNNQGHESSRAMSKIRRMTLERLSQKIQQHFERRDISNREALGHCTQEIDRVMSVLMRRTKSKLIAAVDKMEVQLLAIEGNMRRLCVATEDRGRRMMKAARRTAYSEREEKAILCQWLNGFIVGAPSDPSLTSMDFTFARFALNMAMASGRTLPEVMLNAGVPPFLAGMLSSSNPLVIGPAVMALAQMAHHQACQRALGSTGVIQPLVRLCVTNQSPAVLSQTCIALAQLSRYIPNKPTVAGKGGIAAMVGLLKGYRNEERITVEVVERAFTTLVNIMHRSDANRGLAEECGTIGPTLTIMDTVDNESVLVQACLVLANISFCNQFAALRLLEAEADETVCNLVAHSDKTRHSNVVEVAFLCLANLANNTLNQAHVGASSAIELAVTVCKHCDSPRVVRAAALALCSVTLKNSASKSRCASFDAIPILLEIGAAWGVTNSGDEESYSSKGGSPAAPRSVSADDEVAAAAQAIRCVAILIQHPNNALAMRRVRGLRCLVNIINESEHNEVIIAAAKAVVIITPDPYALVRTFRIGEVSEMEEAGAYDALVRTRDWAFGRTSPPSWLKYGLEVLGCKQEELEARLQGEEGASAFRKPEEFFAHSEFFEEREMVIPPDVTLAQDEDLGGMLFHIF